MVKLMNQKSPDLTLNADWQCLHTSFYITENAQLPNR